MTLRAIRFEPPGRGFSVPLALYADTMHQLAEALRSVRHAVARSLSADFKLQPGEAERIVVLNVEPLKEGSLATPIRVGPPNVLPLYPDLEEKFWTRTDQLINDAVAGRDNRLSIGAAEALASAGDRAREEGFGLSLSELQGQGPKRGTKRRAKNLWKSRVDVVKCAEELKTYAEDRRRQAARNKVDLIGEIVELTFKPPSFKLDTHSYGRMQIKCAAELMREVSGLGGAYALVSVDVAIDADGRPRDAVAISAAPLVHSRTIVKDWERSRGTHEGKEIWQGDETGEYLRDLRKRTS